MDGVEPTTGLNAVRQIGDAVYTVGDAGIVRCNGRAGAEIGSLCNFLGVFRGRVITGGQMGALYDAVSGVELHRHRSPLNCSAVFCRDGAEHLIVGTYTGEGLVFRARAGGALELTATMRLHDNAIKGLACNERDIFSVCATGAAAFHAIDTLECTRRIPDAHAKIANGAACLADGRFLSVSRDRKLRIWGLGSLRVVATPHDHSIKCVAASPNGSLVATGAYDGTVALYDWRRDAWVAVQRPSAFGISSLTPAAAPDEFLASSYDGEVYAVAVGR
jgi:hypothetical protein